MSDSIELESRFLARGFPEGLDACKKKEVLDIYIPRSARHPTLRIRKNGDRFMMTKKEPVSEDDVSRQLEQTIPLQEGEFAELSEIEGKRSRRIRYYYPYGSLTAEISVFKDGLEGLVLIDFEFDTQEQKSAFEVPGFCLAEVTHEEFLAGGMLCGKCYGDIEDRLNRFGYKRLYKS